MVDEDFIKKMIEGKENNRFDRKLKITSKSKIAKTISAFANTDGGIILIGVTDTNKIIGVDPEEEKYMISSSNEQFCLPPAEIEFEEYTRLDFNEETKVEKEVIILLVLVEKSQNGLIYVVDSAKGKKAYHRVNDQSLAM
jgi:predicted HTH transcriptional regulator